jgi:hypothetical protein
VVVPYDYMRLYLVQNVNEINLKYFYLQNLNLKVNFNNLQGVTKPTARFNCFFVELLYLSMKRFDNNLILTKSGFKIFSLKTELKNLLLKLTLDNFKVGFKNINVDVLDV